MQYIDKRVLKGSDVEILFDVQYDADKLEDLLDRIVKKASYKEKGRFTAPYYAQYENNKFINDIVLPNGDSMYENIERISSFDHGDYIEVVGVEVTPPRLAYIIDGILKNKEESIHDLMNYRDNPELISITEKITKANKEIDEIDNFDTDNKIGALERLKVLCENKKKGKYFDTQLLADFYEEALSLIDLSIVKETVVTERIGKILLKSYLEGKKKDDSK